MLKYTIKNYTTVMLKDSIIKALNISEKTYYNKLNATIEDKQGFEVYEMLLIAKILKRDIHELISTEALNYFVNKKAQELC